MCRAQREGAARQCIEGGPSIRWGLNRTVQERDGWAAPRWLSWPRMGKRGTWLTITGVAIVAVVAVGVVGFVSAGDDNPSSSEEYRAVVVRNRDRVDFVLGRLSTAQSLEELLTRMDEAAKTIDAAAGDLDEVTPPEALEDEHGRLVRQLEALSADVQGTADQAREPGFQDILLGADGLSFDSWDEINVVFKELREQGVEVQPLSRHAAT